MKVGIDISQVVFPGGVGRYTTELVSHLLKIDKKNDYVLFGSSLRQQKKLKEFVNNLKLKINNPASPVDRLTPKLYPIPPTILEVLFNQIHFSIDSFVGKVDIIHTSDWTEPSSSAKKVTTIHDLAIFKFPKMFNPKIVEVHKRKLEWVKTESAKIITVSENTKKDVIETLKIPKEKIVVIYEAASASFRPKSKVEQEKIKNKFGIKKDYILTVATRGARKNLTRLFKAFEQLKKDFDLNLVVVGDVRVDYEKEIIVTGFLNDQDLATLYSGAKVFIYPSLYEGFGLPILEVMACGTLVACSKINVHQEIAADLPFYFDPEDIGFITKTISQALELDDLNRQIRIKKGISLAKKFSWAETAKQTLKLYQNL